MLTSNAKIRNEILIELALVFKESGFSLRQNNLIREPEKGLHQVISLSLGPATSMMANHIGLGFGVATKEWTDCLFHWKKPKVFSPSFCEIRDCHYNFYNTDNSAWFSISMNAIELSKLILAKIQNKILPFLDKTKTRQAIIDLWKSNNLAVGLPPRHELSIGILMLANGQVEEGKNILSRISEEKNGNPFYTKAIDIALNTLPSN